MGTQRPPDRPPTRWLAAALLAALGVAGMVYAVLRTTPKPQAEEVATVRAPATADRPRTQPAKAGPGPSAHRPQPTTTQETARSKGPDIASRSTTKPLDAPELAPATPRLIDVNSASAAELELLPGIGPTLAQRIVEDRERNGPFATVEDLDRVSGIGPRTIEKLKELATASTANEGGPP